VTIAIQVLAISIATCLCFSQANTLIAIVTCLCLSQA
jgi:hypothetical protein